METVAQWAQILNDANGAALARWTPSTLASALEWAVTMQQLAGKPNPEAEGRACSSAALFESCPGAPVLLTPVLLSSPSSRPLPRTSLLAPPFGVALICGGRRTVSGERGWRGVHEGLVRTGMHNTLARHSRQTARTCARVRDRPAGAGARTQTRWASKPARMSRPGKGPRARSTTSWRGPGRTSRRCAALCARCCGWCSRTASPPTACLRLPWPRTWKTPSPPTHFFDWIHGRGAIPDRSRVLGHTHAHAPPGRRGRARARALQPGKYTEPTHPDAAIPVRTRRCPGTRASRA